MAGWLCKAHLQPSQPLKSSQHTQIIIEMFFFFSNYFQYLDFKNWNKKLFQVMQLQRKIYWDQLKMCYFCECVKPQKKQLSDITAEDRLAQWLLCGFSAGPNEMELVSLDAQKRN